MKEPCRPFCEWCGQLPHDSRCPNAPDPVAVFICSGCGKDILDGDPYWDVLGEQFCEHCIDEAKGEAVYDPY